MQMSKEAIFKAVDKAGAWKRNSVYMLLEL